MGPNLVKCATYHTSCRKKSNQNLRREERRNCGSFTPGTGIHLIIEIADAGLDGRCLSVNAGNPGLRGEREESPNS